MDIRCSTYLLRPLVLADAASLASHANDRDVWLNNPLKGLRTGVVSLASFRAGTGSTPYETIAQQKRREAAAHAASAGAA